jgi:hypothetical protein
MMTIFQMADLDLSAQAERAARAPARMKVAGSKRWRA